MTKGVMKRWRLACAVVAVGIAGCADGASAPTEAGGLAPGASLNYTETVDAAAVPSDTVTEVFGFAANKGGDFRIGGRHWIHFPANAICDPATSSYGATEWDAPCRPAKGKLTITAVSYTDASGHPRIDFSPELRFVPSQKKNGWVYLTMVEAAGADVRTAVILYCGPDGACVDESASDGTLVTRRSVKLGAVSRRIKHFSGYLMSAGWGRY